MTVHAPQEETQNWLALGLALRFTTTDEGGRTMVLPGGFGREVRFQYRPNWGLPGMEPPEQTGAPVLGFSKEGIAPGDEVRVVIVPPFPQMLSQWATVDLGDVLPMYEGLRVCGLGRVLWKRMLPEGLGDLEEDAFRRWLAGPTDVPEP